MSLETVFEKLLWNSRLVAIVAVIASLFCSLALFLIASVDAFEFVGHALHYPQTGSDPTARLQLRTTLLAHVVEVIDGYLFAAILLIFALGIYELFVSRIDIAEGSEFAERLLLIRSLDDLKDRLAKVVLLILVVKFFEYALTIPLKTPVDLLYFAIGTLLIAGAVWLSHGKKH